MGFGVKLLLFYSIIGEGFFDQIKQKEKVLLKPTKYSLSHSQLVILSVYSSIFLISLEKHVTSVFYFP